MKQKPYVRKHAVAALTHIRTEFVLGFVFG